MLPHNVIPYVIKRPHSRNSEEGIDRINKLKSINYSDMNIINTIISQEDANNTLRKLGIKEDTIFYEFYLNFGDEASAYRIELLYSLGEIIENHKTPFWGDKYPGIEKRYLILSSIEGEYSYFYDKETDALYGVDWGEMDDFMAGKLDPLFTSFYDFLEWYYSEEDED